MLAALPIIALLLFTIRLQSKALRRKDAKYGAIIEHIEWKLDGMEKYAERKVKACASLERQKQVLVAKIEGHGTLDAVLEDTNREDSCKVQD